MQVSREREFEVEEDEQTVGEFRDNVTKIEEEEEAAKKLPGNWIPLKCNSIEDHRESQLLSMVNCYSFQHFFPFN